MRLTKKREFSTAFLKIIFGYIFRNFYFLRFSVKEIGFPIRGGDFFVTFDHMELRRFPFRLCVFPELSFGQKVVLAFIPDIGLRKVVFRAETRFAIIELSRKKITIGFFCDSSWAKSGFLVSSVFFGSFFGTQKLIDFESRVLRKFWKLERGANLERSWLVVFLHLVSPKVSKIGNSFDNFGVTLSQWIHRGLFEINPTGPEFSCSWMYIPFNPRSRFKNLPMEGLLHIQWFCLEVFEYQIFYKWGRNSYFQKKFSNVRQINSSDIFLKHYFDPFAKKSIENWKILWFLSLSV